MSTKKQREEFFKQATALIQGLGGKRLTRREGYTPLTDYEKELWVLETNCGPLTLRVGDKDYRKNIGTVYTRFDDTERALTYAKAEGHGLPDCSQVGKWNHHYFDPHWSVETAIGNLTFNLQRVCKGDSDD